MSTTGDEGLEDSLSDETPRRPLLRRRWPKVIGGVILALALLWTVAWVTNRPTALEEAAGACDHQLGLADDGKALRLQLMEEINDNIDIMAWVQPEDALCLFDELEVPDYVRDHVISTRALDGQQTEEWGELSARWTYHPDDGLQMTIREG